MTRYNKNNAIADLSLAVAEASILEKEVKGRMSFFKRLSYQKGNVVAKHEDILFAIIGVR